MFGNYSSSFVEMYFWRKHKKFDYMYGNSWNEIGVVLKQSGIKMQKQKQMSVIVSVELLSGLQLVL